MSDLILKFYENVISHEEEAISMEKRVTEEVDRITKPYEGTMTREEFEKLQDLLFDISLVAEQEGFQLGIKIFAKLLAECLS